jgi:Phosphodiester glycosidase
MSELPTRSGAVQGSVRNFPCHRLRLRRYAAIAAVAVVLQALAAVPLSAVAAMPAVGSEAVSQGWIGQIHWKSRQLTLGVTVRRGTLSNRAVVERISEAIIDPSRARIEVAHDGILARRQLTSTVARRLRALVAVNAGFFITSSADGFPGAPTGLAVYGGPLESLNNGPRAALIISQGRPRITIAEATVTVRAGQAAHLVNGINRIPGVIEDCGRPGGRPTAQPRQDVTCTDDDELVLFTSQLGAPVPRGPGNQAVLRPDGTVISVGGRTGGRVPVGGWVIQGIGAAGNWLAKHAIVGHRLVVTERVADAAGHPIPLSSGVSIASGAPLLLQGGHVAIDAVREGVIDPADPAFNYSWAEQRQPRTVAGIDRHGRLILVTIDGRQPGPSEGATLSEEAALMRSLGAVDAMNLDGGGSTTMAINGTLFNHPSDPGGERADGDFIIAQRVKTGS